MRAANVASLAVVSLVLFAPWSSAAASGTEFQVSDVGYAWGYTEIMGARISAFASANLTMIVAHTEGNGSVSYDFSEFTTHAVAPGGSPYPPSNGTNPFPYPQISLVYDSGNFSIHQVLEMRFLRLFEFEDYDGDGPYAPGDPIVSQANLSNLSVAYTSPEVTGLDPTGNTISLPALYHSPNVCCGEAWGGQTYPGGTPPLAGLAFRVAATGGFNFSVTGYEWFEPRAFEGVNMTPTLLKLEFQIEEYPYASPTSRLGLEMNLTSFSQGTSTGWDMVPWTDGQGIGMDAGNSSALFAWSGSAFADGVSVSVYSSSFPIDAYTTSLFLSYPHAAYLSHDPVLGLVDNRLASQAVTPTTHPPAPWDPTLLAFLATVAGAAIVVYVVERRTKRPRTGEGDRH